MYMYLSAESFTTFSGMKVYYGLEGRVESVTVNSGDTVVVPGGAARYTVMFGPEPTFVTRAGNQPSGTDKIVLRDNMASDQITEGQSLASLLEI